MMLKKGLIAIAAATMMAGTALTPVEPAHAQIPAFLPNKEAVPAGEPMEIDGDWRVNTIDKVIRIDRGRAYGGGRMDTRIRPQSPARHGYDTQYPADCRCRVCRRRSTDDGQGHAPPRLARSY